MFSDSSTSNTEDYSGRKKRSVDKKLETEQVIIFHLINSLIEHLFR